MCARQAAHALVPDQWRRLTSRGISRSKPAHCECRRGLKIDADGNKTGLNNTTSGVFAANLCGRKYLLEENNWHFAAFSL